MGSIRWIRNVLIDGEAAVLEVMLGTHKMGDRCYVRINQTPETWYTAASNERHEVLEQGLNILKAILQDRTVVTPEGQTFEWK